MKLKHYVRSLPNSDRRENVIEHAKRISDEFQFWDNTHYNDEEFHQFARSGKLVISDNYMEVASSIMNTKKKATGKQVLFPGQVANFYSMIKLFKHILLEDEDYDCYIISEDDIRAKAFTKEVLDDNLKNIKDEFFIAAVGWGVTRRNRFDFKNRSIDKYKLSRNIFRFCNPCFVTNKGTIGLLIEEYDKMKMQTPCDVWMHNITRVTIPSIERYTVFPGLVHDLSFMGEVESEISPKRSRITYLSAQKEYDKVKIKTKEHRLYKASLDNYWRDNYGL